MRLFRKLTTNLHLTRRGFSLVEMLIGVGILGFLGVALMSALDTNSKATAVLDEKITAVHVATAHIEIIRTLPYATSYPTASENVTIPANYNVIIDTECSSDGETFEPCTGEPEQTLQKIIIRVQHQEKPIFSMCTFKNDF